MIFSNTSSKMIKSIIDAPKKSRIEKNFTTENCEDIRFRLTDHMPTIKKVTFDLNKNKTRLLNHCVKCEWGVHCIKCIRKVKEQHVLSPTPVRKINILLFR